MKDLALKIINTIHIALVELANLFIIGMVVIVFTNVVLRYVFQSGILWSEEVSLLLCVWFIFISYGLGIKQRLHITINLFHREKVARWVNQALDLLAEIVAIVIGGTMIIYGASLVRFTMTSIMPATRWPAGILYIVVPFSGLVIVLEAILHLVGWDTYDANIDDYLSGGRKFKDIFGGSHE
ncbi:MAG: Tripartite ATP-independent periplasmic transporter DctQ component [Spirochaetes bacterium]|nr:MAG: Tripartite ATP-independent periplasmic transporter DctQ component [Spirochaetota bacterium]